MTCPTGTVIRERLNKKDKPIEMGRDHDPREIMSETILPYNLVGGIRQVNVRVAQRFFTLVSNKSSTNGRNSEAPHIDCPHILPVYPIRVSSCTDQWYQLADRDNSVHFLKLSCCMYLQAGTGRISKGTPHS